MIDFRFYITQDWMSSEYKVYLGGLGAEYTSHYFTLVDGKLNVHPREEGSIIPDELFTLDGNEGKKILQALAVELHRNGFVVESDNKERIVSQALAEERKEQIEYLRRFNGDIVKEVLKR